jgi:hypothetical protein
MFNRNNYVSLKNIPMFVAVESYTPVTYLVNGENMTLSSIINELYNKQETNILLGDQISSFKSMNSDSIIIQGLEAARLGVQKNIGSYQNVLMNDVSVKDLTDLLIELNDQKDPSESIKRQIKYLKNAMKS